MAYIFMTQGEECVDGTWESESGENAIILQPAPFEPIVEVRPLQHGPTLERMIPGVRSDRLVPEEVEYAVELSEIPDKAAEDDDYSLRTRLGGPLVWLQDDETPQGAWRALVQIDSCSDQYSINFGDAGVAYAFVSEDGRRARFLWQCC
ncbi:MAG: DUF1963 domain-containing protein [Chthoniobacterales bacterium]|nr:DUF1963 domain-containing protein [Chthoniobacterales bacterium]